MAVTHPVKQKCTSLHFDDRIARSGLQGRVANPRGKTLLSSTSLPTHPDSAQDYLCLGIFEEGPAGSSVFKNLRANFGF